MFASTKKKIILVFIALVCVTVAGVVYNNLRGNEVYMRTVTSEEGPLLSEPMQVWIQDHRKESKISAYAYKNDGVYELLLVDNRNNSKGQYLRTKTSSKKRGTVLYVEYTDNNAASENDIQYNQENYFILNKEPSQIKLTINGVEQILQPEIGTSPITQP